MRPPAALAALALLGLAAGARAEAYFPEGARVRPGDWPLPRHDPQNRAAAELGGTEAPRGWTFEPARHPFGYQPGLPVWSSPALGRVGGRAVLAIGCHDRNLYLLDAATGQELWRYTAGGVVAGAPLLWWDGARHLVLAASSDRQVFALDGESGARVWAAALEPWTPSLGGARLSAPAMCWVAGRPAVVVGHWLWDKSLAGNRQAAGLSALDARSGARLWRTEFLDNRVGDPLCVRVDGRGLVLAASLDGNLRALEADTGALAWSLRETLPIAGAPGFSDGPEGPRVVVGSHFGKLRALDARSGAEVWSHKVGQWLTAAPALLEDGGRRLWVAGAFDDRVHAVDALSGAPAWRHALGGPVYSSPVVVPTEGEPTLVVAAEDHQLHGLAARDGVGLWSVFTGAPRWDGVPLGETPWGSPAAARLGGRWMIYFGSYDGVLYAFPLSQAVALGPSPPWSGLRFWLTMAGVLVGTAGLALGLSRRAARLRRARGSTDARAMP
ncbi:MAG TPA: PQQ-binding-like beta-propeller repeat protein [Myxococcota bacterium]|nr:PQQ-binding-like beta-propeller repeat protein [Myxococcota bacterium]HRY93748.1 PQQ-binding-like beta-propeller repeat protein [Myxococcota bacterium]HSA24382.1 PQQ-binding-like beta-propeller repeat protein [Myxococcota bacterium]